MALPNQRTCVNGHLYTKSSDCPTCPVCERQRAPLADYLSGLSAPARRALENKGISSLKALSTFTSKELLQLHGLGPSSIPKLHKLLTDAGLNFRQ